MQSSITATGSATPFIPPRAHLLSKQRTFNSFLPPQVRARRPTRKMASFHGLSFSVRSQASNCDGGNGFRTLTEYAGKGGIDVGDGLVILFDNIQYACKRIAALVASPFNSSLGRQNDIVGSVDGGTGRDAPKPLDIVSVGFADDCVPTSLALARHSLLLLELTNSIYIFFAIRVVTSFLNLVMFGLFVACVELHSAALLVTLLLA